MTGSLPHDAFPGPARPLSSAEVASEPTEDDERTDRLVEAAGRARSRSYAPYSGFDAGAAVRTTDGTVVTGAVVENISLGLAMCAERAALFGAVARGGRPAELALVAPRTGSELTHPCGACLQVALELGGPDTTIVVSDGEERTDRLRLGDLLPRGPHRSG